MEEDATDIEVHQPPDLTTVQRQQPWETTTVIGVSNFSRTACAAVAAQERQIQGAQQQRRRHKTAQRQRL
jgi:hypothetical protein